MSIDLRLQSIESLQKNSSYHMIRRSGFAAVAITQTIVGSSSALVSAVALGVMELNRVLIQRVAPQSLARYAMTKMSVTVLLASISSVALLTLFGISLTVYSVTAISAWIAAPSVAELIVELSRAYLKSTETLPNAMTLLKSSNSVDQSNGFKMVQSLAKKGVKEAHYLLFICYQTGRGVQKNQEQALASAAKGKKAGNLKCEAMYGVSVLKDKKSPDTLRDAAVDAIDHAVGKGCHVAFAALALVNDIGRLSNLERSYVERAAEKGNPFAAEALSKDDVRKLLSIQGIAMEKIAAAGGSVDAMQKLITYYHGEGNKTLENQWKKKRAEVLRVGDSEWRMYLATVG